MTHPTTIGASPLEQHINDYLADNPGKVPTLVATDLIEHGWYGATAEAAERVEGIRDAYRTGAITLRGLFVAIERLAEDLKAEVGA